MTCLPQPVMLQHNRAHAIRQLLLTRMFPEDSTPIHATPRKKVRHPDLHLGRGECHVWHVSLDMADDDLARLRRHLSIDEQIRADSFILPSPRRQFIVTRSTLRLLLGRYLGTDSASTTFRTNSHGKPRLPPPDDDLYFNVSHSGEHALIALCRGAEVGIDIERHRMLDDWSGMAKMIWCAEDMIEWINLSADERCRAFYLAWTRKEAMAKAIGLGMATDFKKLRVSFSPAAKATLLNLDQAFGSAATWSLIDIETPPNYAAALAARSPGIRVSQFRHTPARGS